VRFKDAGCDRCGEPLGELGHRIGGGEPGFEVGRVDVDDRKPLQQFALSRGIELNGVGHGPFDKIGLICSSWTAHRQLEGNSA
jgi:hypothetical protein